MLTVSRRWFLQHAALAGGGLAIGLVNAQFGPPPDLRPSSAQFSAMIRIHPDNRVVIVPPVAEMGQDVITSLAMLIAEELDIDWPAAEVAIAGHDPAFYNAWGSQSAGNSRSVRVWFMPLRRLGAAARQVLMAAAAARWQVSPAVVRTAQGMVIEPASGRRLAYGELVHEAASLPLPADPPLKAAGTWKLLGHSQPRKDLEAKLDGSAAFGADVRLLGMVYAAVSMAPDIEGQLADFDESACRSQPGVIDVVALDNALAVVAENSWQADKALKKAAVTFSPGPYSEMNDASITAELDRCLSNDSGNEAALEGDPDKVLDSGPVIEARYSLPYLAHVCMEPMTATVAVDADTALVIAPTQSPQRSAQRVAERLGIAVEQVEMRNTYLGGGFGRKGLDYAAMMQATDLAKKIGRPVQVNWDRKTDIQQDQFRPAARYHFRAKLGEDGLPAAVDLRIATQSLRRKLFPQYYRPEGYELSDDLFNYAMPARRIRWIEADLPVSVGYWRAVYNSNHPFATESFIDELAHHADQDPYQYRRRLLAHRPRLVSALDAVAEAAGWARSMPEGYGLGMACIDGWGSVCAQVAEVSVDAGRVRIHRLWAAVDCGLVISPDSVVAQVEGAIAYALSGVLQSRISFRGGAVSETNFDDYPVLRIQDMPEIEVLVLPSDEPPGGVGELALPPCAPAVTNALFAASGQRIRSLPIKGQT